MPVLRQPSWLSLVSDTVFSSSPVSCACRNPNAAGGAVQMPGAAVGVTPAAAAGPAGVLPQEGGDRAGVLQEPGETGRAILLQDPQLQRAPVQVSGCCRGQRGGPETASNTGCWLLPSRTADKANGISGDLVCPVTVQGEQKEVRRSFSKAFITALLTCAAQIRLAVPFLEQCNKNMQQELRQESSPLVFSGLNLATDWIVPITVRPLYKRCVQCSPGM